LGDSYEGQSKPETYESSFGMDGRPPVVILDIDEYQEMSKRRKGLGDLKMREEIKEKTHKVKPKEFPRDMK